MLGCLSYEYDEVVMFLHKTEVKIGRIHIIDAYGIDSGNEVAYDVMVDEENCLYKHILELEILSIDRR